MALGSKSWGSFGPPAGGIRNPSFTERTRFPEIRSLASNPWTLIQGGLRPEPIRKGVLAVDLHGPENLAHNAMPRPQHREADPETPKAWNGTLLPAGDPDLWLPVSFAHFEKIVALEKEFKRKGTSAILTPDHLEELGVELN